MAELRNFKEPATGDVHCGRTYGEMIFLARGPGSDGYLENIEDRINFLEKVLAATIDSLYETKQKELFEQFKLMWEEVQDERCQAPIGRDSGPELVDEA